MTDRDDGLESLLEDTANALDQVFRQRHKHIEVISMLRKLVSDVAALRAAPERNMAVIPERRLEYPLGRRMINADYTPPNMRKANRRKDTRAAPEPARGEGELMTDAYISACDEIANALQDMEDYWAYGMAKTEGAEPDESDDKAVFAIAARAGAALTAYRVARKQPHSVCEYKKIQVSPTGMRRCLACHHSADAETIMICPRTQRMPG